MTPEQCQHLHILRDADYHLLNIIFIVSPPIGGIFCLRMFKSKRCFHITYKIVCVICFSIQIMCISAGCSYIVSFHGCTALFIINILHCNVYFYALAGKNSLSKLLKANYYMILFLQLLLKSINPMLMKFTTMGTELYRTLNHSDLDRHIEQTRLMYAWQTTDRRSMQVL